MDDGVPNVGTFPSFYKWLPDDSASVSCSISTARTSDYGSSSVTISLASASVTSLAACKSVAINSRAISCVTPSLISKQKQHFTVAIATTLSHQHFIISNIHIVWCSNGIILVLCFGICVWNPSIFQTLIWEQLNQQWWSWNPRPTNSGLGTSQDHTILLMHACWYRGPFKRTLDRTSLLGPEI